MASVGQKLIIARKERRETLEDVSFRTHIPVARLVDMEQDDLSNFANLTYARSFLKMYSRYLGVDLTDYLEQFDTSELSSISGHEYAQTARAIHNLPTFMEIKDERRAPLRLILAGIAVTMLAQVLWTQFKPQEEDGTVPSQLPEPVKVPALLVEPEPAEMESRPAILQAEVVPEGDFDAGHMPVPAQVAVPIVPIVPIVPVVPTVLAEAVEPAKAAEPVKPATAARAVKPAVAPRFQPRRPQEQRRSRTERE